MMEIDRESEQFSTHTKAELVQQVLILEHERDQLKARLTAFAEALDHAKRLGAEQDEPEGARYIQLSDTLAKKLSTMVKPNQ